MSYNSSTQYFTLTRTRPAVATNTDCIRITHRANLLRQHLRPERRDRNLDRRRRQHVVPVDHHHANTADGNGDEVRGRRLRRRLLGRLELGRLTQRSQHLRPQRHLELELQLRLRRPFKPAGSAIVYSNILGSGPGASAATTASTIRGRRRCRMPATPRLVVRRPDLPRAAQPANLAVERVGEPAGCRTSPSRSIPNTEGHHLESAGFIGVPPACRPARGQPGLRRRAAELLRRSIRRPAAIRPVLRHLVRPQQFPIRPTARPRCRCGSYAPNDSMAGADGFVTLSITNVTGSGLGGAGVRGGPGT